MHNFVPIVENFRAYATQIEQVITRKNVGCLVPKRLSSVSNVENFPALPFTDKGESIHLIYLY